MILVRAPLRLTFVGDATDIKTFYQHHTGRVVSVTIDKFIYLVIKPLAIGNQFIIKYSVTEIVEHPRDIQHPLVRAAFLDLGITEDGLEVGSFSDIPGNSGLGSSSAFSAALLKGLHCYLGKTVSSEDIARLACRLEIDLLGEPIGKQDQYATAYGGMNLIEFYADDTVRMNPILISYQIRLFLQDHLLLFYTGLTRNASSVLSTQVAEIPQRMDAYRRIADAVPAFVRALESGDVETMAKLVEAEWEIKKTLASNVTTPVIDCLFTAAKDAGALGGKLLGAGSGGCLLLFVRPADRQRVSKALSLSAQAHQLTRCGEIPFSFTQSGTDVLFNKKD